MKKYVLLLAISCLPWNQLLAQNTVELEAVPQVLEIVGDTDAVLSPAVYPVFSDMKGDNPGCAAYLSTVYDPAKQNTKSDTATNGLSLAPICDKSSLGNGWKPSNTCPASNGEIISGLKIPNTKYPNGIPIPANFRNGGKLLITWTVRIEGFKPDMQIPPMYAGNPGIHPYLCWGWHGSFNVNYPGGNVETYLYVNGQKKGQPFIMQIPTAGQINMYQAYDPTLTGEYLLTGSDFPGGKLPDKITDLEIRWINKTPMKVVSQKNYRNLVIEFIPVGRNSN